MSATTTIAPPVPEHENSDRLEIIAQFTAGAAHDIRNDSAIIYGYSDIVMRGLTPGTPQYRAAEAQVAAALRIARNCKQLLAFTPLYHPEPQPTQLNQVICEQERNLNDLLISRLPLAKLVIAYEPGLPMVKVDRALFARAISNLVVNARCAMHGIKRTPLVSIQTKHSGAGVSVFVVDNGCGMSAEELKSSLAGENFTTKPGHSGLGLGIVRTVAKDAGGWVSAKSVEGLGTAFEIWLPAVSAAGT